MAVKRIFAQRFFRKKNQTSEDVTWKTLSDDLDQLCQTIIFSLKIDSQNLQQVLIASLYIKILSNYQAILLLLDREMLNESKSLLRGMMEAMFALCAIAKKPELAQRFVENDHTQRLKLSIAYEDLPFKLKRSLKPRVIKLINSSMNGLTKPKNSTPDISPLTVEQLAKTAGLEESYYSVYTMLSGCNYLRVHELEQYWNSNRTAKSLLTLIYPDNRKADTIVYSTLKTLFMTLNGIKSTFDIQVPGEYARLVEQFRKLAAESRNKPRRPQIFSKRIKQAEA